MTVGGRGGSPMPSRVQKKNLEKATTGRTLVEAEIGQVGQTQSQAYVTISGILSIIPIKL